MSKTAIAVGVALVVGGVALLFVDFSQRHDARDSLDRRGIVVSDGSEVTTGASGERFYNSLGREGRRATDYTLTYLGCAGLVFGAATMATGRKPNAIQG